MKRAPTPARAGLLKAANLMSPEGAKAFCFLIYLDSILLDDKKIPPVATRVRHVFNSADEDKCAKKLLKNGMGVFILERDVARHPLTVALLNGGFFGVPHRADMQRLTLDRRPMNELEKGLSPEWLHFFYMVAR